MGRWRMPGERMTVIPFPQSCASVAFRWDRVLPRRVSRPSTLGLDGLTQLVAAGLSVDAILDLSHAAYLETWRAATGVLLV